MGEIFHQFIYNEHFWKSLFFTAFAWVKNENIHFSPMQLAKRAKAGKALKAVKVAT
jgi:hypothetical protein